MEILKKISHGYSRYILIVPLVSIYLYNKRHNFLGKRASKYLFNKAMRQRFDDKYKFNTAKNTLLLGVISPTNTFDFQHGFSLSNKYSIPMISDKADTSTLPFNHVKIDYTNYNNIVRLDLPNSSVSVESGVSVNELLSYGNDYGYTIPQLEQFKETGFTINDVGFNSYNSNAGDIDLLDASVIIPRESKVLRFSPFSDFTKNHGNGLHLLNKSSDGLGIFLNITLRIDAKHPAKEYYTGRYKGDSFYDLFNKLKECQDIHPELYRSLFQHSFIFNDVVYFQLSPSASGARVKALTSQFGIKIEKATELEYYTEINRLKVYDSGRNILIRLNSSSSVSTFITRLKELVINNNTSKPHRSTTLLNAIKHDLVANTIEFAIPGIDDINDIETQYIFIKKIQDLVRKLNGNIHLNKQIITNTKYDGMSEIGGSNYLIEEDIKQCFDPKYLLNPHGCFHKPKFFDFLKRKNKGANYFGTSIKV